MKNLSFVGNPHYILKIVSHAAIAAPLINENILSDVGAISIAPGA
jgi:hypothetical protein